MTIDFNPYNTHLIEILRNIINDNNCHKSRVEALQCINGGTTQAALQLVGRQNARKYGIHFSGTTLSNLLIQSTPIKETCKVYDPACGTGDLLISFSKRLITKKSLVETLAEWNNYIFGTDIFDSFIQTTKFRIALSAILRDCKIDITAPEDINTILTNISLGNGLESNQYYGKADAIVTNPPFTALSYYHGATWGKKNISTAAAFIDKCITETKGGTSISAILPDVLRSGSRYGKWRKHVEAHSKNAFVKIYGEFNKHADIDVFLLNFTNSNSESIIRWASLDMTQAKTVGDLFDVSVGTVVPHRDIEEGSTYKYIHAKNTPSFSILNSICESRKHKGRTHSAPFIALRRTSSPRDKTRCIPTLVNHSGQVAVENHLIVLQPKDKSMESCLNLFNLITSKTITDWLNLRIRCRHLTVSSVKEIPLNYHFNQPG